VPVTRGTLAPLPVPAQCRSNPRTLRICHTVDGRYRDAEPGPARRDCGGTPHDAFSQASRSTTDLTCGAPRAPGRPAARPVLSAVRNEGMSRSSQYGAGSDDDPHRV